MHPTAWHGPAAETEGDPKRGDSAAHAAFGKEARQGGCLSQQVSGTLTDTCAPLPDTTHRHSLATLSPLSRHSLALAFLLGPPFPSPPHRHHTTHHHYHRHQDQPFDQPGTEVVLRSLSQVFSDLADMNNDNMFKKATREDYIKAQLLVLEQDSQK